MDLTAPVFQSALTVLAGVLVYVLGQAIVKLIEPALSLRTLIGKIAGDLVMYANRAETVASDYEPFKTSEEIKALLRISKHEEPRTPSTPGPN